MKNMHSFVKHIEKYLTMYNNSDETEWLCEIKKANKCSKFDFNPNSLWFYSGNLVNLDTYELNQPKYIFLTMNPYGCPFRKDKEQEKRKNLEDFLALQNNYFNIKSKDNLSMVYKSCERIVAKLEELDNNINIKNQDKNYPLLDKYAVAIDWFPFYSQKFSLKKSDSTLPQELLGKIINLFDKTNSLIFTLGGDMMTILNKLSSLGEYSKLNITCSGRFKKDIDSISELKDKLKIFEINKFYCLSIKGESYGNYEIPFIEKLSKFIETNKNELNLI